MERQIAELIEKEAIREQIYTYCRALDRIDNEPGYTVFAEDANRLRPDLQGHPDAVSST